MYCNRTSAMGPDANNKYCAGGLLAGAARRCKAHAESKSRYRMRDVQGTKWAARTGFASRNKGAGGT